MSRKKKIFVIVFSIFFAIAASFGGFVLYKLWPATLERGPPSMDFPIQDPDVIHILGGYGYVPWGIDTHNGIDYGCNASVYIVAWCDLRVTGLKTWFNDGGGHWQTNVGLSYNWKYTFDCVFESWALNETYGNLQRADIYVKVGQKISRGDIIGKLLYHGEGTHIHFGMKESGNDVCPYLFLSPSAKLQFDSLWINYGSCPIVCNTTLS